MRLVRSPSARTLCARRGTIALLGMVLLAVVSLTTLRQSMMKECTARLGALVVLAQASLQKLHVREKAGELTREQAQAEGKAIIGSKDEPYFFVRGYSNDVNYVHPNRKRMASKLDRQLAGEPDYAFRIVRQIGAGDLSVAVEVRPGDTHSLLAAMQQMQHNLSVTVQDICNSTNTIATASDEIAAGNLDLSSAPKRRPARCSNRRLEPPRPLSRCGSSRIDS